MAGLRKYPPVLDEQWFADLVDFLGGPTAATQISTAKIILEGAAGSPVLSGWQYASDPSKIDAAAIYQTLLTSPLTDNLDFAAHQAINMLLEILASDPASPATGRVWYRSDLSKPSIKRASITDRFVLEDLAQTLTNKTLTTPTIGSFLNATHAHQSSAGGGTLVKAAISDFAHKDSHKTGGSDAFALTDLLDSVGRVKVSKGGSLVGTRRQVNLIEGTNVTLTMTDDSGNEKVDVTIAAAGGGSGGKAEVFLTFDLAEATYTP